MTIHPETIEVVLGSIMLVGSVGVGVLALLNEYGPWFLSPLLEWGKLRQEKTEYQRISSIFSGMLHMTVPKMLVPPVNRSLPIANCVSHLLLNHTRIRKYFNITDICSTLDTT